MSLEEKSNEDESKNYLLERDVTKGMNAVSILTGFYGVRGERIRHKVHEGALRLPRESLDIYRDFGKKDNPGKEPKGFVLPGLDSLIRPSLDPSKSHLVVLEVRCEENTLEQIDQETGQVTKQTSSEILTRTKIIAKSPDRIRGGGNEDASNPANSPKLEPISTEPIAEREMVASSANAQVPSTEPSSQLVPTMEPKLQSSSVAPPPVTSSGTPGHPSSLSSPPPQVLPLQKRPAEQWEHQIPKKEEQIETDVVKIPTPDWYQADKISSFEKILLPEWFDGSAQHRTPESYLRARETMIEMSKKLDSRYLTSTMARRSIPGDAGSILRLHGFLTSYALINGTAINDTTPTPMVFVRKSCPSGNEELHLKIREAVVDQARNKRAKMSESDEAPITIDWGIVARTVGGGLSATDCQRQFLAMPLMDDEKEPDAFKGKRKRQEEIFQNLVESTDPAVLQKVLNEALESTEDVIESQKAAVLGIVANQTVQDAQIQQQSVSRILSEIVDLRMQKLENRLAILDDVEGLLDAERVALELERRDLYTARCRHWFGGT
jgi:hypothetical protein